jgi:hypothetical protein
MSHEKWLVMVYMAGDNNLTDECVYALTEMKKSLSSDRVKVFAQFDPRDEHLPTHRYEINIGGKDASLAKDITDKAPFKHESAKHKAIRPPEGAGVLAEDETATGNPRTLFNFLSYCIEKHEADHYMVVLAGHGSGTEKDYLMKDESPVGYLTIHELRWVFDELKNLYRNAAGEPLIVDVLGMDVCLMSMAEICYELRDLVQVMIGCESYSPASGWPFGLVLQGIEKFSDSKLIAEVEGANRNVVDEFAKAIVGEFVNYYADYELGGLSVDQSALNVRTVSKLKNDIAKLAKGMKEELLNLETKEVFKAALILAHWDAQSYNGEQFVDIIDFCDCLRARYPDTAVASLCKDVRNSIASNFVFQSCYSGAKYQYSYGVSIYFPWEEVALSYKNMSFARDSGWLDFLELYTDHTRRAPRDVKEGSSLWEANFVPPRKMRRTDGMGPGDQVRSMRNPPISVRPSPCIGDKHATDTPTERLLFE